MAPVAQAVKHLHSRLQSGCRGAAVFQEVLRRGTVEVTRSGSSQIAAAARTIEAVAGLGIEMKRRRAVLRAAGAALRGHASSSALATTTPARAESPLVMGGSSPAAAQTELGKLAPDGGVEDVEAVRAHATDTVVLESEDDG